MLPRYALRSYQIEPARAIAESIERGLGRQFAVVFSRQAGKDELLAQLLAWLLVRRQRRGGNAVIAAPTYRPQAALSRDRLLDRLAEPRTASQARRHDGYTVQVGKATARFLSAAPEANARGQTADLFLVANEAQDIRPEIWDAVFDPMAASTNATALFMGRFGRGRRYWRDRSRTWSRWNERMVCKGFGACRGRSWRGMCRPMVSECGRESRNSGLIIPSSARSISCSSSKVKADSSRRSGWRRCAGIIPGSMRRR
jgi:hypothetical protein